MKNKNKTYFSFIMFFHLMLGTLPIHADINQTQPKTEQQKPTFDYKNMTKNEVLNLSPEQLSTIDEEAFSKIFEETPTSIPTTQTISSGGSKDKVDEINNLQTEVNQKLTSQKSTQKKLLKLYAEDLLLHQKVDFTQSKIVRIEAVK